MPPAVVTRALAKIYANSKLTVPVSFGAVSTRGFLDDRTTVEEDRDGFAVDMRVRTVRLQTTDAATLAEDSSITIDGTAYIVRKKLRQDDGLETLVYVTEVTP